MFEWANRDRIQFILWSSPCVFVCGNGTLIEELTAWINAVAIYCSR